MTVEVARPSAPPHHPAALCSTCPLFGVGTYVPGVGPTDAALVVVAEGPGEQEALAGEPLVGASGRLLDAALGQLVPRDAWFRTNAVACYTPDRTAMTAWPVVKACRPRLQAEVDAQQGDPVVLALGAKALQSIRDNQHLKITAERGKPFETLTWGKVVATFNPAYIFKNGGMYQDLRSDLELAVEIVDGIERTEDFLPEPEVEVVKNPGTARLRLRWLSQQRGLVAYDIETGTNLKRVRYDEDPITCISFSWGDGRRALTITEEALAHPRVWDDLAALFDVPSDRIRFGAQNGKFDSKYLRMSRRGRIPARVDADSMLAHYCLDERKGTHDLKQRAALDEGAPDYERLIREDLAAKHHAKMVAWMAERRRAFTHGLPFREPQPITTYYEVDRPLLYKYGGFDAAYTQRLILRYERMLAEQGLSGVYAFLLRISEHTSRMEETGVLIDQTYKAHLGETLASEITRIVEEIREHTWEGFNPNSTQQLARALFSPQHANLIPPKDTRRNQDGNWSTARQVLTALSGLHPLVDLILSLRTLTKLKTSYVDNLDRFIYSDGRVRSVVKVMGTVTGRLSAEDPAFMTLPKPDPKKPSIRSLVIAPEGYILLEVDQSQGELRVAAALSGEPAWVQAFQRDEDLHAGTMVKVGLGTLEDSIREMDGDPVAGKKLWENKRKKAKNTAFGTLYGMEAPLLAKMFGWPLYQAQRFLYDYWQAYPTLKGWVDEVRAQAWETQTLVSPYGRVRRYGLITPELKRSVGNEASNFYPQSTLSDLTLETMMDAVEVFDAQGLGDAVRPILFVHDSILWEVREDLVGLVAREVKRIMGEIPRRRLAAVQRAEVPFKSDFKMGASWGTMTDYHVEE